MLMDIMGGVISGAAFAATCATSSSIYDAPQNVGTFSWR